MTSEFGPVWKQKLRTEHERLDLDKDGFVTKNDFTVLLQRFKAIGHASPKQIEKLQTSLFKLWDDFLAETAAAAGPIKADAFVAAMEAQGKKKISKAVFDLYSKYFDAIDTDNDGFISPDEYQIYYQIEEMDPSWAADAFKDIDKDHDGEISKAEFIAAVEDFYCSENPGNFLGPSDPPIDMTNAPI